MMYPFANELPLPKSRFNAFIIEKNELDKKGFTNWVFHPGMLFSSMAKWWGDYGERKVPHEGLDLCYFINLQGDMVSLGVDTQIPVMYDGMVVKIMDDYLGKSIVMTHSYKNPQNRILVTIFGHILPNDHLCIGEKISAGDCIATLANTAHSPSGLPPHQHISVGWMPETLPYDQLDWQTINDPKIITLLNPIEIILTENEIIRCDTFAF